MHSKYWLLHLAEGTWCLSSFLSPIHRVFAGCAVIFFFIFFFGLLCRPKLQLSPANVFGSFGLHDCGKLKSVYLRNGMRVLV